MDGFQAEKPSQKRRDEPGSEDGKPLNWPHFRWKESWGKDQVARIDPLNTVASLEMRLVWNHCLSDKPQAFTLKRSL